MRRLIVTVLLASAASCGIGVGHASAESKDKPICFIPEGCPIHHRYFGFQYHPHGPRR